MFASNTNTNTNTNNWGSATSFGRSSSFGGTGSGSIFGNSSTTQPNTAGFGASTSNTTIGNGLFGNSSGNSNLFGSTGANNIKTNSSTGTGLFGNPSTTNNNSTSTGTGLFGNSSTTNTTSQGAGLFGNSSTNNNKTTSTGLFGNSATSGTNISTGTGLFGNSSNTSGGLFGGSKPTTGGLFGASNSPSGNFLRKDGTNGGLFGNSSSQINAQSLTNNPYGQNQEFTSVKYDIDTMPKSITENMLKDSRISDSAEKKRRYSYLDNSLKNQPNSKQQKSSLLSKLGRTFRFFRNTTTESIAKGLFTSSNFPRSNDKIDVLPKSKNLAPKRISKQPYKSRIVSRDIASIKRLVIKSKPLKYHMIDADKVFNVRKRKILSGIVSSDKLLQDQYSSDEESDEDVILENKDIQLGARFAYKSSEREKTNALEKKDIKVLGKDHLQIEEENIEDPDNKESNNGYWCNPSIKELTKLSDKQLSNIENFIVGRVGYGQIAYNFPVDLSNIVISARQNNVALNKELFENIIKIHHKNIQVYADDESKPPIGFGLNVPATITLEKINPKEGVSASDYIKFLQSQIGMQFVTYDPITCVWVFKVRHFSIWGLIDEAEENKNLLELKRKQDEKEEEATLEYSKIYENPEVSQELKKLKLSYDTNSIPGNWKYNKLSKNNPLNVKRDLLETEINSQITKYKGHKTAVELSANVSDITIESSNSSDDEIETENLKGDFSDKRFDYLKQFVSVLPRNVNINDIVDEKAYEPEISNEAIFDNIKIKSSFPVSDDWLIQLELSNDINSSLNPLVTEFSNDNNVSIEKVDDILFSDLNKSISENSVEINEKKALLTVEGQDIEIENEKLKNFSKVIFELISNSDIKLRENKYPKVFSRASKSFSDIMSYVPVDIEERQYLELGSALFDDFEISDEYDDVDKSNLNLISHLRGLQQKQKIEKWLKRFNKPAINELLNKYQSDKLETIFVHICAGDLKQAILSAINSNNPHLASLITLLDSNDEAVKVIANNQLVSWEESGISEKIPSVVIKSHQILAGNIESASKKLPWNVALAIRLYYGDINLKLFEILDKYFDDIKESGSVLDILKSYHIFKKSGASEALKLVSTSNLSLKLKWYFNKILSINDNIDKKLSTSFGKTLEKLGFWNEAIFIYAHIESDTDSQKLIRDAVIENIHKLNVKSNISDEEEFLITVLKVPKELIYEARAINNAKQGNYWEECEDLINARLWERACKTIVDELGPACVISDNAILKSRLSNLISKFPDEGRIISDWNQTANIYHKYIQISDGSEPDLTTLDFLLSNIPLMKEGASFQSRSALKIISKNVGEMALDHSKELSITKEKILSLKLGENELAYFSIRLQ